MLNIVMAKVVIKKVLRIKWHCCGESIKHFK